MNDKKYKSNIQEKQDAEGKHINGERQSITPYLIIYQSEIEAMVGQADRSKGNETGGELYGHLSHAGRPVIMYATSAGPNAIEEKTLFQQDIEFLKKSNIYLWETFAHQFVGTWHDHHNLSLKRFSPQDIDSTHRIASKNGYLRLCQVLLTNESEVSTHSILLEDKHNNRRFTPSKQESSNPKNRRYSNEVSRAEIERESYHLNQAVRVHAFLYWDATHDQPVRCMLKILPGMSPIRQAIIQNCTIPELKKAYTFPMSLIQYDCFNAEWKGNGSYNQKLPKRIRNQCLQLPEKVRDGARVIFRDDLSVILLPVPFGGMMLVAYGLKKEHRVKAVFFSAGETSDELTNLTEVAACYGPYTNLETIFNRGIRFISANNPTKHQSC